MGTKGNELADKLAKEGAVGSAAVSVGAPLCEIRAAIHRFFYDKWHMDFQKL